MPHKTEKAAAPIIAIVGWKKSGKTTLTVRLVEWFTSHGYKVASIKHAHHSFTIDEGETDSARHRRAGARQVAVISRQRWAMISEAGEGQKEPDLEDVVSWFNPCDLIIVEGYKTADIPKIEARRRDAFTTTPLADDDAGIVAIAADHKVDQTRLPAFDLDDIPAIAAFITRHLNLADTMPAHEPADTGNS